MQVLILYAQIVDMKKTYQYHWIWSFFGLGAQDRPLLHSEIFSLCYYGNGGFTHEQVYNMPIYLRRFYLKSIQSAVDKENEEIKKVQNKPNSTQPPPKSSKK